MEVCDKCGRIIEEDHKCSEIILGKEKEIFEMVKRENQSELIRDMEKLELNDGDLLLFTYDPSMPQDVIQAMVSQVSELVQEHKERLVPVVVLPMTFDLQQMSLDDLKAFRDSAQNLIDNIESQEKKK